MIFQNIISEIFNSKFQYRALIFVTVSSSIYLVLIANNPTVQRNRHGFTNYSLKRQSGVMYEYGHKRNTRKAFYIPKNFKTTKIAFQRNLGIEMQEKGLLRNITKNPLKIILMWNEWNMRMASEPLTKARCPVSSCIFTTDMSLIEQSDVVVLHFDTLEDFPMNRQPHQRFVFYHFESPANTASELMNDPRFRYNYFNWTMTYRRDSDVFLRDYYGSLVSKRSFVDNIRDTRYTYKNNFSDHSEGLGHGSVANFATFEISLSDFIRRKTKMVIWLVSNCFTPIRREEYVRQLSQYVAVDIFGHCTNECPSNCDEMIRTDYKFYLAFENSWCPDYITEKFSRPFLYEAIPIVLGGADYRQFAPPNSYINARDFSSPKHLAGYLLMLDNNDSLYARYFEWKKDYYISVPDMYGWCELCRMALDGNLPPKIYRDIKKWWMVDGGECEPNSTKFF